MRMTPDSLRPLEVKLTLCSDIDVPWSSLEGRVSRDESI